MKKTLKLIILIIGLFSFCIISIEISSYFLINLYLKKTIPELKQQIKLAHKNNIDSTYLAHPTLSYVSNSPNSNNMGFFSKYDYPYERQKNDFVIGMFGGSTADILSWQFDSLKIVDDFKEQIPVLRNKNIVVLSFASGCAKQPMQFQRFSRFAENIDVAINIDGVSELISNYRGADITTPCMTDVLYYNSVYQKDFDPFLNSIFFYTSALNDRMLQHALFERSAAFLIATKFFITLKNKIEIELQNKIFQKINTNKSKLFPFSPQSDQRDLYLLGVENWTKYTKLQFAISQELKVPILFAIAPNILYKDTKPLSSEEKNYFNGSGKIWAEKSKNVTHAYSRLQYEINSLKLKYPNKFIDISGVFIYEQQTLYTDAKGHYNEQGTRIVWKNIITNLKAIIK
jgi:hypothetical protein